MQALLDHLDRSVLTDADARRLFHGRGGGTSGYEFLNIDAYPPVLHISLYQAQSEEWLELLATALLTRYAAQCDCVVVQERYHREGPCRVLRGALSTPCLAREDGLIFELDFSHGRNIGFFPDMRAGRRLVRELAAERTVLNLFAYTGAFSVAALAGGARRVVNLDMSRSALQRAATNHQLNHLAPAASSFLSHNLFKSFAKLRRLGPYELVILDPPSAQGMSFNAERDWPKLLRRLPEWLVDGGEIVACLNAPHLPADFLRQLFSELLPMAQPVTQLPALADFPERDPERGVKIFHYHLPG